MSIEKMSVRGNAHSGNCPSWKCPFGKLCVRVTVLWGTVNRGTIHRGNVFGELSLGEMSTGQKYTGKMPGYHFISFIVDKLLLSLQIDNISLLFILCSTETKCNVINTFRVFHILQFFRKTFT